MCVCVCERERETERDREIDGESRTSCSCLPRASRKTSLWWGWLNPGLRTLDWGFLSEEEEVRAGFEFSGAALSPSTLVLYSIGNLP